MTVRAFLTNLSPGASIRSVAILTSGTTAAQAITALAAPFLTRLYTPDDFGLLAIYAGFLAIFSSISSFRYEMAIPLPEDDDTAAALVVLSLACVAGVSALCAIIIFFFGEIVIVKLNAEPLKPYLWLLPLGILFAGAYQVFSFWHIRAKSFTILAQTKVLQCVSSVSVQLLGYGMGPVALLLGHITSRVAGLTRLAKSTYQYRSGLFKGISFKQVWIQASRYKRFPLYSSWGGLFNVAGAQLPAILFVALFSPETAGLYALANRVLSIPMTLVGRSIGQVYFSKAAEARREGVIGPLVANVHDKLAQLAMPPTLFLLFVAPELFSFTFGPEWHQAGVFVQWLTPMLYFQFVLSPISQTLMVMERQALSTILQGIMLLLRVLTLCVGAWFDDVLLTVGLFGIASTIAYLLFLIVTMHITDVTWPQIIQPTVTALLWGIITVFPLALGNFLQVSNQALLLLGLISFMAVLVRCRMVVA